MVVILDVAYEVTSGAATSLGHEGLGFLGHVAWQPNFNVFGAAVLVFGTLVTAAIALLLGVPVAIASALYLTELCPRRLRGPVALLVDLLAAVPSVVYGLWGIAVLAPKLHSLEQSFANTFSFIPL